MYTKHIFAKSIRAVALCLLLFFACLVPSLAMADTIKDFKCNVRILQNSEIDVTEQITMRIDEAGKHGMVRQIATLKQDKDGRKFASKFSVYACKINGHPTQFEEQEDSDHITIYVGEADKTLPQGLYTFTISYKATRQIGFFDSYDELYWNVTGDMWNCPIEHASCSVELPNGNKDFRSVEWYRGARGEKGHMQHGQKNGNRVVTTKGLKPQEGLTVCYTFNKGLVTEPAPYFGSMDLVEKIAFGFLALSFLTLLFLAFQTNSKRQQAVVIPIWDIPRDVTPSIASYVSRAECDTSAITADIIFLATKGYIKIKEQEQKSGFTIFSSKKRVIFLDCVKPLDEIKKDTSISEDLQDLMIALFAKDSTISLTKKNSKKFINLLENVKFRAKTFLYGKVVTKSLPSFVLLVILLAGLLAAFPFWGEATWILAFIGIACLLPCGICYAVFRASTSVPRTKCGSLFSRAIKIQAFVFTYCVSLMFSYAFICGIMEEEVYFKILCIFMAMSVPVCVSALFTSDYTQEGLRDFERVKGIKLFLDMAEKERLEFFEARNKEFAAPDVQYERFLPYAVALGVAETWAEKFSTQLKQISYVPTWYEGSYPDVFDIMLLNSAFDRLNDTMKQSIAPLNTGNDGFSISGGGSGFGGGGFSGGGGGGGGGGTW